ncbi:zinc ribbon domain-containing protein [Gryllotalpicola reticulitermitis]|uniref:Zinc ribbon domain-containing protein n=1 Tax=Gryllotalpicola reticulitermitis TaxID=1184153 RepID=A0ABV8Q805_9MICO
MKATPAVQKELLRLQEHDNHLTRIAHSTKNLAQDKQLAELRPQAEQLRARLVEATGRAEDARAEQTRFEADLAIVAQRLQRDNERLRASASGKDIAALEGEIESLRRRQRTLEDAELEVMERLEQAEGEIARIRAEQEQLQASVDSLTTARTDEVARLERQRDDARADRMVVAQGIPEDLLAVYERQRTRYGIGAAAVRGGVNLGSNLTLAPNDLVAVRNSAPDDVIIDGESGAILVRDENS